MNKLPMKISAKNKIAASAAILIFFVLAILGLAARFFRIDMPLPKLKSYTPMPEVTPVLKISSANETEMVYIPAGNFLMGASSEDENAYQNEKPQQEVYLDAFWINRTEVNITSYKECVAEGVCEPPYSLGMEQKGSLTRDSYYDNPSYADFPVVYVSWDAAQTYCAWAGKRLPTEAEWEKAARGTDGRLFPWGNSNVKGDLLNFADCNTDFDWSFKRFDDGFEDTSPVGNYPAGASPYGALDMAGNVWEWTADWYQADFYAEMPLKNPMGPPEGTYKVIRGGDWRSSNWGVRTSLRSRLGPEYANSYIGFRCVQDD